MGREHSGRVVQRFALVTLVLPSAVTALGLAIELAALPHAPAQIPVYWDGSGEPSAAGPAWLPMVFTVVLGLGLPAVFGLSSLPSLRRGDRSPTFRVFGAQALGISVMLNVVAAGLLLENTGTTPSGGSPLGLLLSTGLLVGLAAAAGGWFLQPRGSRVAPAYAVRPLELAPSERAAWVCTTSLPTPAVAVITAVTAIVATRAGFGWAHGDRNGGAVILTAVALLLISLLASTAAFHVRVDERGLSVRSLVGVPRFRVATEDVGAVSVVEARSLGAAGSWGIRARPGRVTIVMRPPTGIRVTRRDGGTLFVTVNDAATGAALLETFAGRTGDAEARRLTARSERQGRDV